MSSPEDPISSQNLSRRDMFLNAARNGSFLILGGSRLSVEAPSSLPPANEGIRIVIPTEQPESNENWFETEVPVERRVMRIDLDPENQRPNIGLKEVYIGTSEKKPLLVICALWDENNTKIKDSLLKPKGMIAFQPIVEPFRVDSQQMLPNEIDDSDIPEIESVADMVVRIISRRTNPAVSINQHRALGMPRPESGQRYALVFGAGAVEYDSKLSPASYLSISFGFPPQIPNQAPQVPNGQRV